MTLSAQTYTEIETKYFGIGLHERNWAVGFRVPLADVCPLPRNPIPSSTEWFNDFETAAKDLSGTQSFGIPRMLPGGGPTTLHSKINVEPLSHDDGGSYGQCQILRFRALAAFTQAQARAISSATPEPVSDCSLTSLKPKQIKFGEKVINHGHDCRIRTTDEMTTEIEVRSQSAAA